MNLGFQELLPLLLIILLLFGAARLPKLARAMREARDEFQKGHASPDAPLADETPPPDADKPA